MAKKENTTDLMAGLTFGNSRSETPAEPPVVNTGAPAPKVEAPAATAAEQTNQAAEARAENKESAVSSKSLAEIYAGKLQAEAEPRSVRIQVVTTPTISLKLDDLVAQRKIKSRNDLINFLLEGYLESVK